jgi:hypothetical protein
MNVLVACEFSGIVRDAFRAAGHDAWSCDILPAEPAPSGIGHLYHLQGDVRRVLEGSIPSDMVQLSAWRPTPVVRRWDLMVGHPPCTYLANSGVRWLYDPAKKGRWSDMYAGAAFFKTLLDAPIPRIAIENPVIHSHARAYIGRGPDQTLQPWQFGHGETKRVCLWLKDLPKLKPTHFPSVGDLQALKQGDGWARVHRMAPGPDRQKERSRFYTGIAATMAAQWGNL